MSAKKKKKLVKSTPSPQGEYGFLCTMCGVRMWSSHAVCPMCGEPCHDLKPQPEITPTDDTDEPIIVPEPDAEEDDDDDDEGGDE